MDRQEAQNLQIPIEADSKQEPQTKEKCEGRWTEQEHLEFLNAIIRYGKDWKKVEENITNRTGAQIRSHAQKYFLKINKIIKDRKKIKGKKMPQITETQVELKQYFTDNPLSDNTPKEIIELLKIEKVGIKQAVFQNCNGEKMQHLRQLLSPSPKVEKRVAQKVVQKPQSGTFDSFQEEPHELEEKETSFLSSLLRRKQNYFKNGGQFIGLIDLRFDLSTEKKAIEEQDTENCHQRRVQFPMNDL